jgi:hypothetical protein
MSGDVHLLQQQLLMEKRAREVRQQGAWAWRAGMPCRSSPAPAFFLALKKSQRAFCMQELEDMLLRIERHFKAEVAARKTAEEALANATTSEGEARDAVHRSHAQAQLDSQVL